MKSFAKSENCYFIHPLHSRALQERSINSRLSQRRIEKDFLKENVKKLKEIQAKSRGQESRPVSRNGPLKALGNEVSSLSYKNYFKGAAPQSNFPKDQLGSSHSDYFSLSDGAPTIHSYNPNLHKNTYLSNPNLETQNSSNKESNLKREISRSLNSIPTNGELINVKKASNNISMAPLQSASSIRYNVGSVLAKVKSKRPSCETNSSEIWSEIEKGHRAVSNTQNLVTSQNFSKTSKSGSECSSYSLTKPNNNNKLKIPSSSNSCNQLRASSSCSKISCDTGQLVEGGSNSKLENYQNESPDSLVCRDDAISPLKRTSSLPRMPSEELHQENETSIHNQTEHAINSSRSEDELQFSTSSPNQCSERSLNSPNSIPHPSHFRRSHTEIFPKRAPQTKSTAVKKQITREIDRRTSPLLRAKASNNFKINPPPSYRRGELPRYLQMRKDEERKRKEIEAARDPYCPPGHTLLPDTERQSTLDLLYKGHKETLTQISRLPLIEDTFKIKAQRRDLEAKLSRIEEGIEIFSQQKVYVLEDE